MIREAIKEQIKELKISQVQLSSELEINRSSLTSFLSGKRALPFDDIERILKYLRLTIKKEEDS